MCAVAVLQNFRSSLKAGSDSAASEDGSTRYRAEAHGMDGAGGTVYGGSSSAMAPIRLCGRRVDARVLALGLVAVIVLFVVWVAGGDGADGAPVTPAVNAPANTAAPPAPPAAPPAPPAVPATTCRDDLSWVDTDGDDCSTCKLMTAAVRPLLALRVVR